MGGAASCEARKDVQTCNKDVNCFWHGGYCQMNIWRMSDEPMPMNQLLERLLDTEVLNAVSQNKQAIDDDQME